MIGKPKVQVKTKLGAIIVGSNSHDPQFVSKWDKLNLSKKKLFFFNQNFNH